MSKRKRVVQVPSNSVGVEDDLVHAMFRRDVLADIYAKRGAKAIEGIFKDLRACLCDGDISLAEQEAADMLSPMETFDDGKHELVMFEQKVDVL